VDAGRISRLRDALGGGHLALQADRDLAASIIKRWPGTAALVTGANDFHRRAASWAVSSGKPGFPVTPAAGVIFAASGYPHRGGFHAAASLARPDALFAYADADPGAVVFSRALLAALDPAHVSAYEAPGRDPAAVLGAPQARAIMERGPVMVQLQLCAHWWPAGFCAWAVGEYARLLAPGSTLALSLAVPGGGDAGALAAAIGGTGGTVHPHTEDDVAQWIAAAGLELTPIRVTDVRGRELGWAAAEFGRQRPVARMIEAVAVVPDA
jgi:hypothetical protein